MDNGLFVGFVKIPVVELYVAEKLPFVFISSSVLGLKIGFELYGIILLSTL